MNQEELKARLARIEGRLDRLEGKVVMAVDAHDDVPPRTITLTAETVRQALEDEAALRASPFGKALAAEAAALLGPHYDRR